MAQKAKKASNLLSEVEEVFTNSVNHYDIPTDKAISLFNYLGDLSQFVAEYISNHKSELDNLNPADYPLGRILADYMISKEDKKNNELREALNKGVIRSELAYSSMILYIISAIVFPSKRK